MPLELLRIDFDNGGCFLGAIMKFERKLEWHFCNFLDYGEIGIILKKDFIILK